MVQCGALYEPVLPAILTELPGTVLSAADFLAKRELPTIGTVIVIGIEGFATSGVSAATTLGQLRIRVEECLDSGIDICMFSTAPKCAFKVVPGSSLLDDSSLFLLPHLTEIEQEQVRVVASQVGLNLPGVAFAEGDADFLALFSAALSELGVGVLAALDHALFETAAGAAFLDHIDPRELEAMRAAGLAIQDEAGGFRFSVQKRVGEFRAALADVMAEVVEAPQDLADISDGLWRIERSIRRALRKFAVAKYANGWRNRILHGDLAAKVLARAKADANVSARSVAELRDPIEWMTLGELLEVIDNSQVNGMAVDAIVWKKFAQEIVPIRNRLSHMRLPKKGDGEVVALWVAHIQRTLG